VGEIPSRGAAEDIHPAGEGGRSASG